MWEPEWGWGTIQMGPPQPQKLAMAEAGKGMGKGNLSEKSLWYLSLCSSILQVNYLPGQYSTVPPYALVTEVWLSGGRGRWYPEGRGPIRSLTDSEVRISRSGVLQTRVEGSLSDLQPWAGSSSSLDLSFLANDVFCHIKHSAGRVSDIVGPQYKAATLSVPRSPPSQWISEAADKITLDSAPHP